MVNFAQVSDMYLLSLLGCFFFHFLRLKLTKLVFNALRDLFTKCWSFDKKKICQKTDLLVNSENSYISISMTICHIFKSHTYSTNKNKMKSMWENSIKGNKLRQNDDLHERILEYFVILTNIKSQLDWACRSLKKIIHV